MRLSKGLRVETLCSTGPVGNYPALVCGPVVYFFGPREQGAFVYFFREESLKIPLLRCAGIR